MKIKILLLLFSILLITSFLHLYRLEEIPPGIDNDETEKAYDAFSILRTGKDQWGKDYPIIFKGYGDYRLEAYTYLIVPSIAMFGLTTFAVRFPAVLFALGSVLGVYLLGKILFNSKAGLISSFLLAFSPWFFGMTRVGIEAPLATFFMIYGTFFFLRGLKNNNWFFPSAIFFPLMFYGYLAHRIIGIFFIIGLILLYRKYIIFWNWKTIFASILFLCVLFPLVRVFVYGHGSTRINQVIFTQDIGVMNRTNEQRAACQKELNPLICKAIHNKTLDFTLVFIQNYFSHYLPTTLFITGMDSTLFVMPPMGLFLLAELPIFMVGLYHIVKSKKRAGMLCLFWLGISAIPDSFTGVGHYSRYFIIFPSVQLISGLGATKLRQHLKWVLWLFFLLALAGIIVMLSKYFGSYRVLYSKRSHYEYRPLFSRLFSMENKYENIYISRAQYDTKQYTFYLFFTQYDPSLYQKKYGVDIEEAPDGWVAVKRIGKWHFVDSLPDGSLIPDSSLIVGGADEFKSKGLKNVEKTKNLDGTDAFYLVRNCTSLERKNIALGLPTGSPGEPECYY